MDFNLDSVGRAFWHHFSHLRVVAVEDGIEVRVLSVRSCIPCRLLWETLTPVSVHGREIYPASRAERYRPFGKQAFLRDDLVVAEVEEGSRAKPVEPHSYTRVRRFTDWEGRRGLERY